MTVFVGEDPALPEAEIDECEAVIACLGDDAALLRRDNPDCEMAANMDAAADMLEKLRAKEVGAAEAFGHVVQDKRDLEAECKRLHELLAGTHAQIRSFYLGTPEVRLAAALKQRDELRHYAMRALVAWDGTVLPKAHDGMMQERMECLRAALAGLGA
jgi:hypothetical protein